MICFFALSYVVFERMLGLSNANFYVSFFLANLPFVTTITTFIVFSMSLRSRFTYINDIFDQMRFENPKNVHLYDRTKESQNPSLDTGPKISGRKVFTISNKVSDGSKRQELDLTTSSTKTGWMDNRPTYERVRDIIASRSVMKRIMIEKTISNSELKQHIDRLIHLHSKLCDCISLVNELVSFKLLLATVYMFVFIVFACFTGYR